MKPRMLNITISLPEPYIYGLNRLASRKVIESRSHGIREAIKLLFSSEPNFNGNISGEHD